MVTSENVSLVRKILYSEDPFQDLPFSYPPRFTGVKVRIQYSAKRLNLSDRSSLSKLVPGKVRPPSTWLLSVEDTAFRLKSSVLIHGLATGSIGAGVGVELVLATILKIVNGFPRLYYQFMSNVIHAGYSDMITPLPLTGIAGAKLFEHYNISPDIIYIDGDHEYRVGIV